MLQYMHKHFLPHTLCLSYPKCMDLRCNDTKDIYDSQQVSVYGPNISLNGPAARSKGHLSQRSYIQFQFCISLFIGLNTAFKLLAPVLCRQQSVLLSTPLGIKWIQPSEHIFCSPTLCLGFANIKVNQTLLLLQKALNLAVGLFMLE